MAAMTNLERLERFYTEQGGKAAAAPSIVTGKNFAFLQTLPASKTSAYNFQQQSLLESGLQKGKMTDEEVWYLMERFGWGDAA